MTTLDGVILADEVMLTILTHLQFGKRSSKRVIIERLSGLRLYWLDKFLFELWDDDYGDTTLADSSRILHSCKGAPRYTQDNNTWAQAHR